MLAAIRASSSNDRASAGETPRKARTIPLATGGLGLFSVSGSFSSLSLLFFLCFLAPAVAAAFVTSKRNSSTSHPVGTAPGACGGGEYANPGDSGLTEVCLSPTWYAQATILSPALLKRSPRSAAAPHCVKIAFEFRPWVSTRSLYLGSAPGRSAKENTATRSHAVGTDASVKIKSRSTALVCSPKLRFSVLCTRGGGEPSATRAASGCHETCTAVFPSNPRSPSTRVYASACTAVSTFVGTAI
mmetsp:Transcript_2353/g.9104  ORF Transcript_2353/g.9104 Transcript_2353/m.9104 type:complete len:244 (+) Transcript_2353:1442-2173(+)